MVLFSFSQSPISMLTSATCVIPVSTFVAVSVDCWWVVQSLILALGIQQSPRLLPPCPTHLYSHGRTSLNSPLNSVPKAMQYIVGTVWIQCEVEHMKGYHHAFRYARWNKSFKIGCQTYENWCVKTYILLDSQYERDCE